LVEIVVFERGGGSLSEQISAEMGRRSPTTVGIRKPESLGHHVVLFAWSYV